MLLALLLPTIPSASAGDCDGAASLKLNEFVYATGAEWVELYNPTATEITLVSYALEFATKAWGEGKGVSIPDGTLVPAGGFLVIGASGVATKDVDGGDMSDMGNGSGGDAIRITCGGAPFDTVVYSSGADTAALTDETGAAWTTSAPNNATGASTGRVPDGQDAQNDGADWFETEPTPGAANVLLDAGGDTGDTGDTGGGGEEVDCSGVDSIRINEFLADPDGADEGQEWVEFYNRGSEAVDLSGWSFHWDNSDLSSPSTADFPDGTLLDAGGFLVLGAGGLDADLNMGNAGSSADGIQLVCGEIVVDTVIYGDANSDGFVDDSGAVATSLAPAPASGIATARVNDGVDTDQSGVDFVYASENTPGSANIVPHCDASGGERLKLNEVLYNPDGSDEGNEFVEIYNAGESAVNLEGFSLEAGTSSYGTEALFPAGIVVGPGEFFVIGGSGVAAADYVEDGMSLGNATTAEDAVRIVDCEGTPLDTLLYGDDYNGDFVGDNGATDPFPDPGEGSSIGRFPDGADTDLHTDWIAYSTPSPGEPNADPGAVEDPGGSGGGGGGGSGPGDDGCGGPSSERPDGGCAAVPLPLGGLEVFALAFLGVRRRR